VSVGQLDSSLLLRRVAWTTGSMSHDRTLAASSLQSWLATESRSSTASQRRRQAMSKSQRAVTRCNITRRRAEQPGKRSPKQYSRGSACGERATALPAAAAACDRCCTSGRRAAAGCCCRRLRQSWRRQSCGQNEQRVGRRQTKATRLLPQFTAAESEPARAKRVRSRKTTSTQSLQKADQIAL
jgi:hypothetical protein